MRFISSALFPLFAVLAAALPNQPRTISANHGTIAAPTSGTPIASGGPFPFAYSDSNWCHGGYTPISVWLTSYAPTTANLNSTGQIPDATYYFGTFLVANFGLPPMNPSPPATLTMPDLSGFTVGSEVYVAVVETANTCPPGNQPPQYGLTASQMVTV